MGGGGYLTISRQTELLPEAVPPATPMTRDSKRGPSFSVYHGGRPIVKVYLAGPFLLLLAPRQLGGGAAAAAGGSCGELVLLLLLCCLWCVVGARSGAPQWGGKPRGRGDHRGLHVAACAAFAGLCCSPRPVFCCRLSAPPAQQPKTRIDELTCVCVTLRSVL